jgi:hypothetical protein
MTIQQMHIAINLGLQRIASHVFDDFLPQEIDLYLNQAINKYVEAQRDVVLHGEPPASVKGLENIRTLVHSATVLVQQHPLYPNGYRGTLPSDPNFAFFLDARVIFPNGAKTTSLHGTSQFRTFVETVDNQPLYRDLPVTLEANDLVFLRDSGDPTPEGLAVTYITDPAQVMLNVDGGDHVNCNLPQHTHQNIVDVAVELMHTDLAKGT